MLDLTTRWNASRARRIIAISSQTRDDLVRHYGVSPDKISVIHSGVDHERFHPATRHAAALPDGVRQPFILFVSTVQPRKNVDRLIEAFVGLNDSDLQLGDRRKDWLAC